MPHLIEEPLIILGFGGHARSVADVALSAGYQKLIFIDENARVNERFCNFEVLTELKRDYKNCFLAAGNNILREKQWQSVIQKDRILVNLLSPHAILGLGLVLKEGIFLGHNAYIGPMAKIGIGCIINTAAIVEHDCIIGNFCHISVNATVAGGVNIGNHVFIGAGAVIRDGVTIGNHITVGAGATVITDLRDSGTYVGTPAKLIKSMP